MSEKSEYEQTEDVICNLPMTWIPALLILMIKVAYQKKVFVPGKATQFIRDNVPGECPWKN